jgi:serine/threonine protein kinase
MIKKIEVSGIVNEPLDIDMDANIDGGGEAEIYGMPVPDYLLKLYNENLLDEARKEKILDLCSRYETFKSFLKNEQYALPEIPAIEISNHEIIGFAMKNMGKLPQIISLTFKEDGYKEYEGFKLNDNSALELIYNMYGALVRLHQSKIILGDLNPSNILYTAVKKRPVFVDIDSAQVGKYSCPARPNDMMDYLDPIVEESGKNTDGCYTYSTGSDYFSLAVICYELFVGASPYGFRTRPPEDSSIRKNKRICLINFLEDVDFGKKYNIELIDRPQNKIQCERLKLLKAKDPLLYKYFFETFVLDKRESLLAQLPKDDKRNPGYTLYNRRRGQVKTIKEILEEGYLKNNQISKIDPAQFKSIDAENMNKFLEQYKTSNQYTLNAVAMPKDPKAFMMFVDNLGLDYNSIIRKGT